MITSLKIFEFALKSAFPTAQIVESGLTEEGFYCVSQVPPFSDELTLPLLEEKIKGVIKEDYPIKTFEMMRENGAAFLAHHKQPLAAEQVRAWPDNTIRLAEFEKIPFPLFEHDIGKSTGEGGALKILHVERKGELTEFRVVVKDNQQGLKQWLKSWKSWKDPTLLGHELGLFTLVDQIPFWKPKGVFVRNAIQKIICTTLENSPYQPVFSPTGQSQLIGQYFLSLPDPKSLYFREWIQGETGKMSRFGLLDTTPFTRGTLQSFVLNQQVEHELISSLQFFDKIIKIFGFEGQWNLAADRAVQTKASRTDWDRAVKWLAGALEARGGSFSKNARHPQTWVTALEGPTLEAYVVDRLGRKWLLASLGIDLSFPVGVGPSKGAASHRTLLKGAIGESLERIIALLLESSQGVLPWEWTPEQMRVLSVGQHSVGYAAEVHAQLVQAGFRAGLDCDESKLGAKVHAAELERIPYLVVIGDRELKNGQITVRSYEAHEDLAPEGTPLRLDDFLNLLGKWRVKTT